MDLGSLMGAFLESAASHEPHDRDAVYSKSMVYDLVNALNNMETVENDLRSFKAYIEKEIANTDTVLSGAVSGVQYSYDLNPVIYTKSVDDKIVISDAQELLQKLMMKHMKIDADMQQAMTSTSSNSMMPMMGIPGFQLWQEMLPGLDGQPVNDLLLKQYDVLYGSWPNSYNEIVLVVDEKNELDDMTLYALGLKSEADMDAVMDAAVNGTAIEMKNEKWSYEEICNMEFRIVLPGDCFIKDESTGLYTDLRETDAGVRYLYDNGVALKVVGIIRPSEEATSAMLQGSICYSNQLTRYIIEQSETSQVVADQKADPTVDVINGLTFRENTGNMTDKQKEEEFRNYIATMDEAALAATYVKIQSIPTQEILDASLQQQMGQLTVEDMRNNLIQALTTQMNMNQTDVIEYVGSMSDEDVQAGVCQMVTEQIKIQYAARVQAELENISDQELAFALKAAMETYTTEQCAQYYDEVLEFSDATYEDNLILFGSLDLEDPAAVNIYATSFESKDLIEQAIADYNASVEELKQIRYTDYVGIIMSSVTTIINAITYVLIAFVSISLVVSSIMIGVITLISVQERTKEIGILRAIGASKRNVSNMFNAETVMIGAASGLLGVGVTYLLCIPINAIIHALVILICISILLSVFAGFIPSRSAAKKDPVVALRTE